VVALVLVHVVRGEDVQSVLVEARVIHVLQEIDCSMLVQAAVVEYLQR
jgi:hypothetical protein